MNNQSGITLKNRKGWFAAGREVARALPLLSDGAFKLYVYICLHANRATGRLVAGHDDLARALRKDSQSIGTYLQELEHENVCCLQRALNNHSACEIEVSDGFWPYTRAEAQFPKAEQRAFVNKIRGLLAAWKCVECSFTAADEKLSAELFQQNVSLEQINRAILLGCARKYISLLDGKANGPITTLGYFRNAIDEVAQLSTTAGYWDYLLPRVKRFEKQWLDRKSGCALSPDGPTSRE